MFNQIFDMLLLILGELFNELFNKLFDMLFLILGKLFNELFNELFQNLFIRLFDNLFNKDQGWGIVVWCSTIVV